MTDLFDQTPLRQNPHRWRLSRAGFVNVWHYYENTFDISGGRLILRGTNGSGKSRALEMLLPFLLDADRRNMGTGSSVRMEDLMSAGAGDQGNRLGYMWLELCQNPGPDGAETRYLTLGALVRFTISTKEAKVWYFSTPLRVGSELPLLGADRQALSRRDLADLVTEERITDVPEKHRERVRAEVFGLTGQLGKERFDGLTKLLHTLRSPDVGNRIEEGRLPAILADALPPLSEDALTDAGQQLDGLTSTRDDQLRLEAAREQVRTFLDAYRKYVTGVLASSLQGLRSDAVRARAGAAEAAGLDDAAGRKEQELSARKSEFEMLESEQETLGVRLAGLRDSDAYRSGQELRQLTTVVESRAGEADTALRAADDLRRAEKDKVTDADVRADDVEQTVAGLSVTLVRVRERLAAVGLTDPQLPAEIRADRRPGSASSRVVRTDRDGEPEVLTQPVPDVVTLVPADLAGLTERVTRAGAAGRSRAGQAGNRAADAQALSAARRKVDRAADDAASAEQRADDAAEASRQAVEQRDRSAFALADGWRAWIADPATAELFGTVDWSAHPILGVLLADRSALCDDGGDLDLRELDRAADDTVAVATSAVAAALSRLDVEDGAARQVAVRLENERTELRSARDPEPEQPTWVTGSDGVPMWRCVDFSGAIDDESRAGIEAALIASGLLTATVDGAGRLAAPAGHLLVTPHDPHVRTPLSAVLTVDPASPLPAEAVLSVLNRIGFGDDDATTWIRADGSWANGALRGRHHVPVARHIGAAARAAARAVRLAAIDAELAELAEARRGRRQQRDELLASGARIRDWGRAVPSSVELVQARSLATDKLREEGRWRSQAAELRRLADDLNRAWAVQDRDHRRACSDFGLPADEESLRALQSRAQDAARGCAEAVEKAGVVEQAITRHEQTAARIAEVAGRRDTAEGEAARACQTWQNALTRLRTLRESVGIAAAEVHRQVTDTERLLAKVVDGLRDTRKAIDGLNWAAGKARSDAQTAAGTAERLRLDLGDRVTAVRNQFDQPGVIATAFPSAPDELLDDPVPAAVERQVGVLLAALRRGRTDENSLLRAQQVFEREISGSYDVSATVAAGIKLFELVDAEGRRPLAQAADEIDRRCERGRAALTEREHAVFHRFVLGEVGEELRRRLAQADKLIKAMNASLRSIRTSHGIGVRLTWKLADETGADIARIKALVSTAAAVRDAVQDDELTDLLTARVAAEAVKEPSAGYAVHLRSALDYRAWHTVEVIITGPEEGRERRISRRAKLSQGETRFVSYVTLFAAVDAYLTGLENTTTALRLILLDDAFAKVDDATVAELLGLLVRLDVDFAMTGHALWGCVPQVPALDIYEICREEGTPAATAHVHWDGRTRHFLRAA
ncbi:TIGR02680 family protein [Actinoplanes sp. L3-i22]|uniref:TIGR02680 family protein n=1 Tax=Actinoplanes sp. L3-i22 TaxID=2836373 RepID=UPI001C7655B7|nr:TIGR02680 family protein [Actinoplanes sp. L3-i22]BCY13424.1 hypothetical protein L3i22_085120 [Actinoplanes sp. L3-i22]